MRWLLIIALGFTVNARSTTAANTATAAAATVAAAACPFCDAPTLVMAEQIQMCDHLLLGRYIGGEKATDVTAGTSRFEIVEVAFSKGTRFQPGQTIELPQAVTGAEKSLFTLMGPEDRLEDWLAPSQVTDVAWKYLAAMPLPATEPTAHTKRLEYFLPYFEHPDTMISNDAFAEFAAAPYSVIVPLRDKLPREKIMQWLNDPKVSPTRVGFYGLLAGLCGKPDDAPLLEQKILVLDADFRLGIEGVMAGYILLRGEPGLKTLEDAKMRTKVARDAAGKEVPLPFSETYAVMQALRFLWTYEPNLIPADRLKESMRILLDRQELADLVITDLARWKDWTLQDRLMAMYDDEKFAIPAIRRAVVRYLYYCSQEKGSTAADGSETRPETALKAEANLKLLEQKDPKTVSDAKRFLVR
ncbi:MAG: hypothetical protein RLZZ458_314 [Planctomycetota bacterium]